MQEAIYFITGNKMKFREFGILMKDIIKNYNIIHKNIDLVEIQGTPHQIIEAKCLEAAKILNGSVIVEDVSLCFNAINGLPGPYIKHFLKKLGHHKLAEMVHNYEDHSAYALCNYAFYNNKTQSLSIFEGRIDGTIVKPNGDLTLGWDAIFMPSGYNETFAIMDLSLKNMISHRAQAISKLKAHLASL
jgi:inosine triphosphate pyrophosphatase